MHQFLSAVLLVLWVSAAVAAKDTLAILPFSGGAAEEGETIAELFSFEKELTAVFDPIPRTSIKRAIQDEQRFQMESGMTDPDTIKALGTQLGAQYVVAGSITKLSNRNLLIIAILKIDDLRQIAGDIQVYGTIGEIRGKLPAMAKTIAEASKAGISPLPMLAVLPLQLSGGTDEREADTLAQILWVNLIRNGKYAVYPRTKTLEQVQEEYDNQFGGDVADEYLPKIGVGHNPRLVLSVKARTLEGASMFNAAVINLETGIQEAGDSADYRSLNDGMQIMEILALKLSDQEGAAQKLEDKLKKDAEEVQKKALAAEESTRQKEEAKQKWKKRANYANRNSFGGLGFALEWSGDKIGMGVEMLEFHWSLLPFTSVGIGLYPYLVGGYNTLGFEDLAIGGSLYVGLVYPLTTNDSGFNARLYTDFLYNMKGVFSKGLTTGAGFDAGLALTWDGFGLEIRYRGVVYEGHYVNSLGIGFVMMFNDW
jgi:TolB-like protein